MVFERFRRPRWRHSDPSVRRQEVARMSMADAEEAGRLSALATGDADASVRAVAVKRLDALDLLRRIVATDSDEQVREAATLRYRQLLAGGVGEDGGLDVRMEEVAQCHDAGVLAHVLRNGREESLRAAVLERVDDPSVIEEVALHDPVFRLRQAAVQRLEDVEALGRIAGRARALDRRIARLARQRADEWHRLAEERERLLAQSRALCEEARELVDRPALRGTEQAERERLRNRWAALGDLPEGAPRDRFEVLMTRLEARLAEARTRDRAADQARWQVLDEALAVLEGGGEVDERDLERLRSAVDALPEGDDARLGCARAWLDAGQRYLAEREAMTPGTDAETIEAALARVAWPSALPEPPTLAAARDAAAPHAEPLAADDAGAAPDGGAAQSRDQAVDSEREAALEALAQRLEQLDRALESGRFKPARRALQSARSLSENIPGQLPRRFERWLARDTARVAELEDWRRFAVLPKQRDLCERMEALIDDSELTAPERAHRIRELQDEWKATGGSDSAQARELWQRFSDAARRAFEPCREHFDREAERRRENLAARQAVADQLEEFLDAKDLAAIATEELDRIRRTARADWRSHSPVDRDAAAELSKRFEALMDRLTEVINARRDVAGERKAELVAAVEALLEWDDAEAAAERAKVLQTQWKAAGAARPSRERRLWSAFRSACDRLFERRDAARREDEGRVRALAADVEAVCEHMEQLAAGDDGDGDPGARAEELRQRYRGLPLPEGRVGRALRHRFERADRAVAEREAAFRRQGEMAAVVTLLDWLADREPGAVFPEALPEGTPGAFREALATGRQAAGSAADPERHRALCIALEIRAGIESPAADRDLRMRQQVERLSDGLIGTAPAGGEAPDSAWVLLAEWVTLGGASDPAQRERVRAAMEAILAGES